MRLFDVIESHKVGLLCGEAVNSRSSRSLSAGRDRR